MIIRILYTEREKLQALSANFHFKYNKAARAVYINRDTRRYVVVYRMCQFQVFCIKQLETSTQNFAPNTQNTQTYRIFTSSTYWVLL